MAEGNIDYPQHYPVLWTQADTIFEGLKGQKKTTMLSICGNSKRVWKITSPKDTLSMIVITDVMASKDWCEEGTRCLDFNCALNKTTPESLSKALGIKRLPAKFRERFGKPIDFNLGRDGNLQDFKELFARHPNGGWLLKRAAYKVA